MFAVSQKKRAGDEITTCPTFRPAEDAPCRVGVGVGDPAACILFFIDVPLVQFLCKRHGVELHCTLAARNIHTNRATAPSFGHATGIAPDEAACNTGIQLWQKKGDTACIFFAEGRISRRGFDRLVGAVSNKIVLLQFVKLCFCPSSLQNLGVRRVIDTAATFLSKFGKLPKLGRSSKTFTTMAKRRLSALFAMIEGRIPSESTRIAKC